MNTPLPAIWPALPLDDWVTTRWTVHRYAQIVGKVRLALMPFRNHWWHVTLAVDARGLTTGPMPAADGRTVQIRFDLVDHRLLVESSGANVEAFDLVDGLACADFYAQLFAALGRIGVDVRIDPAPYDLAGPLLSRDRDHDRYDADAVGRYWTVLRRTTEVLDEFAGRFVGKQSPVHLFWHSFDLALARFSGRPAPSRPGADPVTAEAYSHEVIAFGFWPGDDHAPWPGYYSYTAPAPPDLTAQRLLPDSAWWDESAGSAYLRYDDVRTAAHPRLALLEFLSSAYNAGSRAGGWDRGALATSVAPEADARP
jgi:hypothetical protein